MKVHYEQPNVGHYGVFNGSRWRAEIAPRVMDFISSNRAGAATKPARKSASKKAGKSAARKAPKGPAGNSLEKSLLLKPEAWPTTSRRSAVSVQAGKGLE